MSKKEQKNQEKEEPESNESKVTEEPQDKEEVTKETSLEKIKVQSPYLRPRTSSVDRFPKIPTRLDILGDKRMFTEEVLADAQHLIDSNFLPGHIKKPEQVVVITQKGRELGFTMMASLQSLYVVNNTVALMGSALMKKLSDGEVEWKTLYDYEPVYIAGGKKGTEEELLEQGINIREDEISKSKKVVDGITVIRFRRPSKLEETGYREEIGKFSYIEANTAGLFKKDNWKNYLRLMMWWRAFSIGGKRIGSDLTMGMSTVEELDTSGNLILDQSGNVINIQNLQK